MAWSDPSTHVAGYLVTADDYNEIINNLKHLRGQDGTTVLEGDVDPEVDLSKALGGAGTRWNEGHFNALYASNGKYAVHQYVRHLVFDWEDNLATGYQIDYNTGGGGTWGNGGSGQMVAKVDDNAAGTVDVFNLAEVDSGKDTSFAVARSPYFRFEFSVDHFDTATRVQIGLEDTPVATTLWANTDNIAGIYWDGTAWVAHNSDGGGAYNSTTITANLVADQRHVIEILVISGGNVLIFVDGTLRHTGATLQPTGDLEWVIHFHSVAGGGADDSFLTLGRLILQEDLS